MLPRHVPRKDVGSRTRTACGLGGKLIRKFGKRSFLHYTATTTKKRVTTPPLGCIFIVMSQQSTTTCHLQHCAICDVGNACSTQFCASIIGSSCFGYFQRTFDHRPPSPLQPCVCVWCATFLPLAKLCTANRVPAHGKKREKCRSRNHFAPNFCVLHNMSMIENTCSGVSIAKTEVIQADTQSHKFGPPFFSALSRHLRRHRCAMAPKVESF